MYGWDEGHERLRETEREHSRMERAEADYEHHGYDAECEARDMAENPEDYKEEIEMEIHSIQHKAPPPAIVAPTNSHALISFADVERMADAFAKSGLFGLKTKDQALALMLLAQAEGLHPATAARDYNIIQGRPSKKPEAMQRDFIDKGGKITWHEYSDTCVAATFSHPMGGTAKIDWDFKRANQAGLGGKDNWKKWPRQMLRSRVISEGCKAVYPAATGGLYTPEEVQDFEPPRNVTPPPSPPPPAPQEAKKKIVEKAVKKPKVEATPSADVSDFANVPLRVKLRDLFEAVKAASGKDAGYCFNKITNTMLPFDEIHLMTADQLIDSVKRAEKILSQLKKEKK